MFGVMNRCLQGTVCSSYLLHYLYFSVGTAHRLARQIGEDVVHIGLLQLAFQLIRRSQSFYFTIHHDGYSVAILRFVHVMRGDKNRYSTLCSIANQFPELSTSGWINTSSRLIEEHNAWVMEDTYRESQLLFPS